MRSEGLKRLNEIDRENAKLAQLESRGAITPFERHYREQLRNIDFSNWEAEQYARQGLRDEAVNALVTTKLLLDSVAGTLLVADGIMQGSRERQGLILVPSDLSRPVSSESQALYDAAKAKYDNAARHVEQIFGGHYS